MPHAIGYMGRDEWFVHQYRKKQKAAFDRRATEGHRHRREVIMKAVGREPNEIDWLELDALFWTDACNMLLADDGEKVPPDTKLIAGLRRKFGDPNKSWREPPPNLPVS